MKTRSFLVLFFIIVLQISLSGQEKEKLFFPKSPLVLLGKYSFGDIEITKIEATKEEIITTDSLGMIPPEFKVISFSLSCPASLYGQKGNKWSNNQKLSLKELKPGDILTIDDVMIKDPNSSSPFHTGRLEIKIVETKK